MFTRLPSRLIYPSGSGARLPAAPVSAGLGHTAVVLKSLADCSGLRHAATAQQQAPQLMLCMARRAEWLARVSRSTGVPWRVAVPHLNGSEDQEPDSSHQAEAQAGGPAEELRSKA